MFGLLEHIADYQLEQISMTWCSLVARLVVAQSLEATVMNLGPYTHCENDVAIELED